MPSRDLQMFEAGAVQPLNPLRGQQVAIGDDGGDRPMTADGADNFVEVGMEQRFATTDGDDARAQRSQLLDPPQHFGGGHRIRDFVVLVAVGAGKIAAPHGNDVRQDGMMFRLDRPGHHPGMANPALIGANRTHKRMEDHGGNSLLSSLLLRSGNSGESYQVSLPLQGLVHG
jgi:hypothetical protein